jgi:hypothetical protein
MVKGETGKPKSFRRNRLASFYIELPLSSDEVHETAQRPATQKISYRQLRDFGDQQYERLGATGGGHVTCV